MPSVTDLRPDVSPNFSKNIQLERTQAQWLFNASELLLSPSILDGMSVTQELANRQKGVNFITQVGIMLKLPQLTLATASVYLHRFFMRHAMVQHNKPGLHHYSVAATALFLATKVEENYRKMKELVVACCRVAQKQPNLVVDEQSKEYWKWRDTILHNEDLLLEALCFDLQLEQPYRLLLDYLRYYDVQANKQLRNTSWAFLNDSLVTTMCLQLTPAAIAGSALYMGVKFAGISLPDDERGRPWWDQLDLDIRDIQRGCVLMAEVYENPALPRQGQKDAYTKDDDMAMFERTRAQMTPLHDPSPSASVRSGSQGIKRDRDTVEGRNSTEWGANPSARQYTTDDRPRQPSPKRLRQNSQESRNNNGLSQAQHGVPENRSDPTQDTKETNDDMQRRIDQIVSSNPSRVPLPRRPSTQSSQPGNSLRRHSSSGSQQWNGQSAAHSNGHADLLNPHSRPSSRDNAVAAPVSSTDTAAPPPRTSPPPPYPEAHNAPVRPPPASNGMNDIDDAEKVDYGSEEGEL
jgi:protein BUR2